MNVDSDIRNRTFGIEIEMCNLERAKVTLPEGYSWSKEESIDNTDCSSNKQFGGEVNTPPLHLCCLKSCMTSVLYTNRWLLQVER